MHLFLLFSLSGIALLAPKPAFALPAGRVTIDPADSHRFLMDGQPWYLVGYYPAIAALTADQTDYVNYYKNFIGKLSEHGVNYFRNVFNMGQPYQGSMIVYQYASGNSGPVDLTRYNQEFFDYWRSVITYARDRGVVVQLCIFDTWHNKGYHTEGDWGMASDFYHGGNNVNGIDTAVIEEWTDPSHPVFEYQKAMIERVVDSLGDLPNIVYEISNENYSNPGWEIELADYLTGYESSQGLPRHLVMPRDLPNHDQAGGKGNGAEGVHEQIAANYSNNRPLIADNDGGGDATPEGRRKKYWAALTGGGHVDYFHFELYLNEVLNSAEAAEGMRYAGYVSKFIRDLGVDLSGLAPADHLVSNGWAYAKSGDRYVIYLINGGSTTVQGLSYSPNFSTFTATWFNPRTGASQPASGGPSFSAPGSGDWVLYIRTGGGNEMKGDLNNDGVVDVTDLGILLSAWGATHKPPADINQDGSVNVIDLGILLSNWG